MSVQQLINDLIPVGAVQMYAGAEVPQGLQGWLLCDGRAYPTAEHENLSDLIRARFLLPDTPDTHFNVPDLRNRTVFGAPNGINVGARGGSDRHTHRIGEIALANHRHRFLHRERADWHADGVDFHNNFNVGTKIFSGSPGGNTHNDPQVHNPGNHQDAVLGGWGANGTEWFTGEAGGSVIAAHETGEAVTLPPYLVLNYIIKT
jgi:microcystin-dependent protein